MKKVILTAFAIVGILATGNAKTIVINKCDPSSTGGYKDVGWSHSTENDTHQMSCMNPGDKACKWDTDPWGKTQLDDVDQAVTGQIMKGNLTGSIVVDGARVDWDAVELNNFSYTIQL
ncbi:hypothetical protein ACEN9X_09385 [Mucilaginibacter sp. Mucisp86]|uniref:hypothetical protein n=1 Tax=Mucilaginibacter sp. Mucisp86 TaxID=3243060 RepID=UPI0039B37C63